MAVTESVLRAGVNVKLNAGQTPSGGMRIVGVSLGHIVDGANAEKVMNVVSALTSVLSLSPVRIERTKVTVLEMN